MSYEWHEAADIFPVINGDDYNDLVEDISKKGLLVPIKLFDGKKIDGRNRERACRAAGKEPEYVDATEEVNKAGGPVEYVMSMNDTRRHMEKSQRAMVAAKAKKLKGATSKEAAEEFGVAQRTVEAASKVLKKGSKALVDAVESGDVTVATAAKIADLPKAEQSTAVKERVAKKGSRDRAPSDKWTAKDDSKVEANFSQLAKLINKAGDCLGLTNEHQRCMNALDACIKAWKEWEKRRD